MGKGLAKYKGEEFDCVVVDPATGQEVGRVKAFIAQAEDNVGYTIKLLESTSMYPDTLKVDGNNPDDYVYCGNYTYSSEEAKELLTKDAELFLGHIVRTGELKVPGELGKVDDLFELNGWPCDKYYWSPMGWSGGSGCAF